MGKKIRYVIKSRPRRVGGANKALMIAKKNRRILRKQSPEVKYHDVSSTGTVALAGSSTVVAMCTIPQGDTVETRDGAKVNLKSIHLKGYFQKGASATQSTFLRVMLVQSQNDSIPTSATMFRGTPYVTSFRHLDYTGEFRVLHERVYRLDDNNNEGAYFKINWSKFPKKTLAYDRTDTTGTNAKWGKLYFMITSEEATYPASYQVQARIKFTDA